MSDVLASVRTMPFSILLGMSALAGATLGTLFFGGLWWTTRRAAMSTAPALWLFGSLLLRMTVALSGFHVVADGHWERMLMCLLGFVVARVVLVRLRLRVQPARNRETTAALEIEHASQP